jgi:hypothetical protein
MAKVKIISTEEQHTPPAEGKLFITEDERIIIAFNVGERVISGTYLDTGLSNIINISSVSPVPSTWKIVLTNE